TRRGNCRGRYPVADNPKPVRRRLQRSCPGGDSYHRSPCSRLAIVRRSYLTLTRTGRFSVRIRSFVPDQLLTSGVFYPSHSCPNPIGARSLSESNSTSTSSPTLGVNHVVSRLALTNFTRVPAGTSQ